MELLHRVAEPEIKEDGLYAALLTKLSNVVTGSPLKTGVTEMSEGKLSPLLGVIVIELPLPSMPDQPLPTSY